MGSNCNSCAEEISSRTEILDMDKESGSCSHSSKILQTLFKCVESFTKLVEQLKCISVPSSHTDSLESNVVFSNNTENLITVDIFHFYHHFSMELDLLKIQSKDILNDR